jgi:hypothetical protein
VRAADIALPFRILWVMELDKEEEEKKKAEGE